MLEMMVHGPWKGAILGDEPGLGQTFTAMLVARRLMRDDKPDGAGLTLIVTHVGCFDQWLKEIDQVFPQVSATQDCSRSFGLIAARSWVKPLC